MPKKSKKPARPETEKNRILDKIGAYDALVILKALAREDESIANRIKQIALEYLRDVDIEGIAGQVFSSLETIDVEDVWEESGSTRFGYVDPTDRAWEMFEETLEPFIEELKKYLELSMHTEAKNYCMGILKGIYQFDMRSESAYKEWVEDAPYENFRRVLDDWKENCENPEDVQDMEEFVKQSFPGW